MSFGNDDIGPVQFSDEMASGSGFSRWHLSVPSAISKTGQALMSPAVGPVIAVHVSTACCSTPSSQAAMKSPW